MYGNILALFLYLLLVTSKVLRSHLLVLPVADKCLDLAPDR